MMIKRILILIKFTLVVGLISLELLYGNGMAIYQYKDYSSKMFENNNCSNCVAYCLNYIYGSSRYLPMNKDNINPKNGCFLIDENDRKAISMIEKTSKVLSTTNTDFTEIRDTLIVSASIYDALESLQQDGKVLANYNLSKR